MRLEIPTSNSVDAPPIDPKEFISALSPCLHQGNIEEALDQVRNRWTSPQIIALLEAECADVRKVAALTLSAVGDKTAVGPLAVALHDSDPMVVEVAEHALWCIWFRLGNPRSVSLVKCGNTHMHHGNYVCAIEKFSQAIQEDGAFAEAYNQRAIAHYLSEHYDAAISDCKVALALMPQHFGAMAGMAHCYAHKNLWKQAKHCYRLALAIHPQMEGVRMSLDQIEQLLRETDH
jgi:tetratricopeptide (TPR) repeat protein